MPRMIALAAIAGIGLAVWAFPVIWGLLTSFKTERDVLAYPPVCSSRRRSTTTAR